MRILGTDMGYGFTKGMTDRARAIFRSMVSPAEDVRFESDLHKDGAISVRVNGRWRFVGDYASLQSDSTAQTLDPTRTGSDEQLSLFYAAASELIQTNEPDVAVVTGLPVADFDERNKARLREMLSGDHVVERSGKKTRRFTIGGVYLVPQAIGALFAHVLDKRGQIADSDLAAGRVGIIDVGTLTTNFCLADNLRYVESASSSIPAGMSGVLIKIAKDLKRDHGLDWALHLDRVDYAVRARSVELFGQDVPIDDIVDAHMRELAETVIAKARSLWSSGADLRAVVLTGGGAFALDRYIRLAYPHVRTGADPQWSNVTGYLRAGLRRFGHEQ